MSLLAAPYVVAGTVSLFLGYKTYNSYYNQPFEYLEIEGFEKDTNRKTQEEDEDVKVEPEVKDDEVETEDKDDEVEPEDVKVEDKEDEDEYEETMNVKHTAMSIPEEKILDSIMGKKKTPAHHHYLPKQKGKLSKSEPAQRGRKPARV